MDKIKKKFKEDTKRYFLGVTTDNQYIYMSDFSWDCGWYWGGGYLNIHTNNRKYADCMTHFDSVFFDRTSTVVEVDKNLHNISLVKAMFQKSTLTEKEWWRLMDLMKQFYSLREGAEVFQYGGHYTSWGRTDKEINLGLAEELNNHIENVIIPEVRKLLTEES